MREFITLETSLGLIAQGLGAVGTKWGNRRQPTCVPHTVGLFPCTVSLSSPERPNFTNDLIPEIMINVQLHKWGNWISLELGGQAYRSSRKWLASVWMWEKSSLPSSRLDELPHFLHNSLTVGGSKLFCGCEQLQALICPRTHSLPASLVMSEIHWLTATDKVE